MKAPVFFAVLLGFACSACTLNTGAKTPERLTYFSFGEHGSMANSGESYSLSITKDGQLSILIDEGMLSETKMLLPETTLLDSLLAIVKTYKMDKYKNDYRPPYDVFDGDSWSLYYSYDSGRSLSSGGYMAWPKNFSEARQAIVALLRPLRERQAITSLHFSATDGQGHNIEYSLEHGTSVTTLTFRDAERSLDTTLALNNSDMCDLYYYHESAWLVKILREPEALPAGNSDATSVNYSLTLADGTSLSGTTGKKSTLEFLTDFFRRWLPR